jgi:ribosomal protein L11 methyltransferase
LRAGRVAHRYPGRAEDAEGALAAELWELGARAVQLDGDDLIAFFEERTTVPEGGSWEEVEGLDHVAAYFEALLPVDLGALVVAPTHREVTLRAPQKVVWSDPGMAFGTGHHESTRLVLRALGERDLSRVRVLDIGAGSGILAITAAVLGAAEAVGVDSDRETLAEARDNAARNRVTVRFEGLDAGALEDAELGTFDMIVANLSAEVHVGLMPVYTALLRPGGRALLSGIVAERADVVIDAVTAPLASVGRTHEGDWILVELERREAAA